MWKAKDPKFITAYEGPGGRYFNGLTLVRNPPRPPAHKAQRPVHLKNDSDDAEPDQNKEADPDDEGREQLSSIVSVLQVLGLSAVDAAQATLMQQHVGCV